MQPDEPTDEERLEELPQDNQTAFQPADPPRDDSLSLDDSTQASNSTLDSTHPVTDSGIDTQQLYDEGVSGAAGAKEPNSGNSVTDYEPNDEERQ
jgi:hypothetical protein